MTVMDEAAPGISSNSPNASPKARAIRKVTASVGLASSRSIWLSIDRLTPLARAKPSSDQPRVARRCFTRRPRCRLIASLGSAVARGAERVEGKDRFMPTNRRSLCDILEIVLAYRIRVGLIYG